MRENHHYPRGQRQHDPHVLRVLSPPALTTAPVRGGCVVTGVSCGIMHATRIRHCSSGGADLLDETASRWATTCRILAKHTLGGQGADADSSTGVRSVILRSQHRLETWTCPRSCLPSWGHLHKAGQMVAAALRQGGKNGTEWCCRPLRSHRLRCREVAARVETRAAEQLRISVQERLATGSAAVQKCDSDITHICKRRSVYESW